MKVELVFLRDLSLLPDVAKQVFASVAARLELAKANIEEDGRQRIALLDANTAAKIAHLIADAKGQYPAAVGRALRKLQDDPEVLAAYEALYEISLVRPHRTVVFSGFENGELRPIDAAMLPDGASLPHQLNAPAPHAHGRSGTLTTAHPAAHGAASGSHSPHRE